MMQTSLIVKELLKHPKIYHIWRYLFGDILLSGLQTFCYLQYQVFQMGNLWNESVSVLASSRWWFLSPGVTGRGENRFSPGPMTAAAPRAINHDRRQRKPRAERPHTHTGINGLKKRWRDWKSAECKMGIINQGMDMKYVCKIFIVTSVFGNKIALQQ